MTHISILLFSILVFVFVKHRNAYPYEYQPFAYTEYGIVSGTVGVSRSGRQFASFKGIPYAQPPTGDLRFKVS